MVTAVRLQVEGVDLDDDLTNELLAEHFPDDTGGFFIGFVLAQAQIQHAVQHAAVYGFQAISHIGQGAAHDNGHRIVDVRGF